MLALGTLFLILAHFFHLTLAVPNPANGVSPDDPAAPTKANLLLPRLEVPGTLACYKQKDQKALLEDVFSAIQAARTIKRVVNPGLACQRIVELKNARIGVCGAFDMSGKEFADRAAYIEWGCSEWHTDWNGPTGGTYRDPGAQWLIYIN